MADSNRRNFVVPILGSVALASACSKTENPAPPPQVMLGQTGITMSRLGFGTGVKAYSRSSKLTRQNFDKSLALFRHCYDRGITFFDLADAYGTHPHCRELLRHVPREKVTILTKLWWRDDSRNPGMLSERVRRHSARTNLKRFRQELGTNYLDIVLLHCLEDPNWASGMKPYMDVFAEEKEAGKVKAVGVSCHSFGALQAAAKLPWVDVILARLNPHGVGMDDTPENVLAVLKEAKANGKAIIGMKIYGEGKLVRKREECMRYVQSCGMLDAMTIGMMKPSEVDENLALLTRYPAV